MARSGIAMVRRVHIVDVPAKRDDCCPGGATHTHTHFTQIVVLRRAHDPGAGVLHWQLLQGRSASSYIYIHIYIYICDRVCNICDEMRHIVPHMWE